MNLYNLDDFIEMLKLSRKKLAAEKKDNFNRSVSFGDLVSDRDENAQAYFFGEGTTCYDNVLIIGNVSVGKNVWIGPNVILDGSGDLIIGDNVTISAGVQIYTHDTVSRTLSGGKDPIVYGTVKIGENVYIGPSAIIQKGVMIGNNVVVGAMSFVNRDIDPGSKVFGIPARPVDKRDV